MYICIFYGVNIISLESYDQKQLPRTNLRICGTLVESLATTHNASKCEKKVQVLLCQNLNVRGRLFRVKVRNS